LFAAINLGERLGPTSDLAIASADLGNIFGLMRLHRVARTYHRLAIRTADRLNNPVISANVLARTGLYQLGIGNWGACRDFEAAMACWDEIGDSFQWEVLARPRACGAYLMGDFELAAFLSAELRQRAGASRSSAHEVDAYAIEVCAELQ